jgi:hypothetical protein
VLNDHVIGDAFNIPAHGQSVGRAYIDGAVLIYDLDDVPEWATELIAARDDDGNVERRKDGGAEFSVRFPYADERTQMETELTDEQVAELQAAIAEEAAKSVKPVVQLSPEAESVRDQLSELAIDTFEQRMQAINAQIAIETERRRRPKKGPVRTGQPINPRKAKRRQSRQSRKANR